MILINLLPPELRKSSSGYNPLVLAGVGGAALCLLLAAFFGYIHFKKLPDARALLVEKQDLLTQKTALAQVVLDDEAEIASHEETKAKLLDLLARKVFWAHTLDDFANLLASNFPGFTMRCLDLNISPTADRRGEASTYAFRGRYQVVGDDKLKAGEYVKAMFKAIGNSAFWKSHGFAGKPEDTYFGDQPQWNTGIGKVIDSFSLEFQRVKTTKPKAGG